MSLKPEEIPPVPEETARVARAAFPDGSPIMRLRDALGTLYDDELFADLFPTRGQPGEAPWRLALVTVFQFMEDLSDRQAAQAVRRCIDWKYGLSLELTDPGFDFSVLSEFRARLLAGEAEQRLLTRLLEQCQQQGWLKAGGKQRTDSTHVLTAVRALNRLELVGETLRYALNMLAEVVPDWLRPLITPEGFERYSRRIEEYRLPKGQEARQRYAEIIGADGAHLLAAIERETTLTWLQDLPAVLTLRQVWKQQYVTREDRLCLRKAEELPPTGERMDSPYDPDARFGNKRSTTWTGYKVHLTETCDADAPHLITHVETTEAMIPDVEMTEPIQLALADKHLLPTEHIVDAGYTDADWVVRSQRDMGVEVVGPVRSDSSWQARKQTGYDVSHFQIDWQARQAVCPQGHISSSWTPHEDAWGNEVIAIKFSRTDCRLCPVRASCTKAAEAPRHMTVRPQMGQEALVRIRAQQETPEWKERYDQRAGIEGTLSQGIRLMELRQARYVGLQKVRLQHIAIALALNMLRIFTWLDGTKPAKTRTSRFAALALAG
jgi:transposase